MGDEVGVAEPLGVLEGVSVPVPVPVPVLVTDGVGVGDNTSERVVVGEAEGDVVGVCVPLGGTSLTRIEKGSEGAPATRKYTKRRPVPAAKTKSASASRAMTTSEPGAAEPVAYTGQGLLSPGGGATPMAKDSAALPDAVRRAAHGPTSVKRVPRSRT